MHTAARAFTRRFRRLRRSRGPLVGVGARRSLARMKRYVLLAGALTRSADGQGERRAPHQVAGSSGCLQLPGFAATDIYPMRSPLIVADYLAELARGRQYAEIGTRDGDIVACVRGLGAARAYAIEQLTFSLGATQLPS